MFEQQYLKATFQVCVYWAKRIENISDTFGILASRGCLCTGRSHSFITMAVLKALRQRGIVNSHHMIMNLQLWGGLIKTWAVPWLFQCFCYSPLWFGLSICVTLLLRHSAPVTFSDISTHSLVDTVIHDAKISFSNHGRKCFYWIQKWHY